MRVSACPAVYHNPCIIDVVGRVALACVHYGLLVGLSITGVF